jgi:hypothetical protein
MRSVAAWLSAPGREMLSLVWGPPALESTIARTTAIATHSGATTNR